MEKEQFKHNFKQSHHCSLCTPGIVTQKDLSQLICALDSTARNLGVQSQCRARTIQTNGKAVVYVQREQVSG